MATTITITQDGVVDERDLSASLETSLLAFMANQNSLGQSPAYKSLAEVIFFSLTQNLFRLAVGQFPPKAVTDAQALAEAAVAAVEAEKSTVLAIASKDDIAPISPVVLG